MNLQEGIDFLTESLVNYSEEFVNESKGKSLADMVEDKLMALYDGAKDYKQGVKDVKAEAKSIKDAIDRLLSDIE